MSKLFDDPEESRHVEFEVETQEGHNLIKIWAYTEQEQVSQMEAIRRGIKRLEPDIKK